MEVRLRQGQAELTSALASMLRVGVRHAQERSQAAKSEFKKGNPCPSTGKSGGGWRRSQVEYAMAFGRPAQGQDQAPAAILHLRMRS